MPHSNNRVSWVSQPLIVRHPFDRGHGRAFPHVGHDFELVHQSLDAWESQTQSTRSRVTCLHGLCNIGDAWSFILGDDGDARFTIFMNGVAIYAYILLGFSYLPGSVRMFQAPSV